MGWRATTISGTGEPRPRPSAPASLSTAAFTLVELIIAISVVAVLTGVAVPVYYSVQRERIAREPVNELFSMAREARLRAIREARPYEIVFSRDGVRARLFLQPYGGTETFETERLAMEELARRDAMVEASRARGIDLGNVAPDRRREQFEEGLRYQAEYSYPEGVRCSLRFWNDTQWVSLEGAEVRRWIFQPSGMCDPLKFRVEAQDHFFEVEFHPLTADIRSERSWVE